MTTQVLIINKGPKTVYVEGANRTVLKPYEEATLHVWKDGELRIGEVEELTSEEVDRLSAETENPTLK